MFYIEGYSIESEKAYNVLLKYESNALEILKKADKNSDKIISEDELVEVLALDEDSDSSTDDNSTVTDQDKRDAQQIEYYDEQNVKLEERINNLSVKLIGEDDPEKVSSIVSQMQSLQSQIDSNAEAVYQILVKGENRKALEKAQAEAQAQAQAIAEAQAKAQATSQTQSASDSTATVNGTSEVTSTNQTNSVNQTNSTDFVSAVANNSSSGGSNFATAIVNTATSFVGKLKETDNSYLQVTGGRHEAWCADFVTYVVKQASAQTGAPLNGFGSPSVSNLKSWARANNCYLSVDGMTNAQKAEYIAKNIKPGDIIIQQNGVSHTGIVTKVYPDGSYDTVEGNTSDQCLQRHYKASDTKLSGFIQIA